MKKLEKSTKEQRATTSITDEALKKVGIDVNNLDILQFNNLAAFAGYMSSIKNVKTFRTASQTEGDGGWYGTEDFNTALDLVLKPYGPCPITIQTKVEDIEQKIRNNLHKKGLLTSWVIESYHYDVEGDEIDIAKLIEGNPDCYLKANKKYKDHFYDLHVNICVSCGVSTQTIIDGFCKTIAVVAALEKRGHKIRLFATSISKNVTSNGNGSLISVCIKPYDGMLDIKTLARIIYPSFLRRLVFKVEEVKYQKDLVGGYGQAVDTLDGVVTLSTNLSEEDLLNDIVKRYVAS